MENFEKSISLLAKIFETHVQQSHDPLIAFNCPKELCSFADVKQSRQKWFQQMNRFEKSPTALIYKKAFEMYSAAEGKLLLYKKDTVENEEDCEFLQSAFHGYAEAEMCENHLFDVFKPQDKTSNLIDQYLKLRPDDYLTEYFQYAIVEKEDPPAIRVYSKHKHVSNLIVRAEKLAYKVHSKFSTGCETNRKILTALYGKLGALYSITCQTARALDSFEKHYDLDQTNYTAMFDVAYHCRHEDPNRAKSLLLKYIDIAPECAKKYFDAFYVLCVLSIENFKDLEEAKRYYRLAQKAESKQLPWNPPDLTNNKLQADLLMLSLNQ